MNHGHLWLTATLLPLARQNVLTIVLQAQHEEALEKAAVALDNEEKRYGLLKPLKQTVLQ